MYVALILSHWPLTPIIERWFGFFLTVKANTAADKGDQLGEDELLGQMSCVLSTYIAVLFWRFMVQDTGFCSHGYYIQRPLSHHPPFSRTPRCAREIAGRSHFCFRHGWHTIRRTCWSSIPWCDLSGDFEIVSFAILGLSSELTWTFRSRYPPVSEIPRQWASLHPFSLILSSFSLTLASLSPCRTREAIVMPLSTPIQGKDGKLIHEIIVPKDTTIHIGIRESNRNKAVWGEDAYEWKPERWLKPLPRSVTDARIPGVYSNLWVSFFFMWDRRMMCSYFPRMTFLGGGRSCMCVIYVLLITPSIH